MEDGHWSSLVWISHVILMVLSRQRQGTIGMLRHVPS